MKVVLASDKFKGSLGAAEVAAALDRGLRRERPDLETVRVPVADGGDGTLMAFAEAGCTLVPVTVTGPTGESVTTAYARRGDLAVVELADASGLSRLGSGPAPLTASTIGTGQAIAAAVAAGCREVVVGLGGSASTDGGLGMLVGLGATAYDASGCAVPPHAGGLAAVTRLDLAVVHDRLRGVRVTVASDVDNPLLGSHGAAAVYAPQKGAGVAEVELLERSLARWADVVAAATGHDLRDAPGAGAAGGAGFAALAVLSATRRPGIEVVLDLVGYDQALTGADLVVTGEGSLDAQSLRGKAPLGVASRARAVGVPVVAVCGRASLTPTEIGAAGLVAVWSLVDLEPDLAVCLRDAARLLADVGALVAAGLPGAPA